MKTKKIKIIHVITRMIVGGAQENTLYTVEGISDKFNTILVTGPTTGPEGKLFEKSKNTKKYKYKLKTIPHLCREINFFKDLITLIELILYFIKEKPDIVHTHSSKAGILGRIAAKIARIPVIIHTIHGLPFHEYQNKYINFLYIFCEKLCSYITTKTVCVADAMWKKCLIQGIGKRKLYCTIRSGIDYDMFFLNAKINIRKKYNIPKNKIVIGKIARLFELKGYEYVLESAKDIINKFPEIIFMFVGGGNLEKILKEKAEEYGIINNIIFTGLVSPDEVPSYINAMNIVVHASLREGLARVIPQSFLLKKPIVSFDVDGAKEIIIDGKNGFLVKPKDISGLTKSLMWLIKDPKKAVIMGKQGYNTVKPFFSKEVMCNELKKLYFKLLKKYEC